ncbi:MAG: LPXTG cell wall anchor domain-containing protein [Ruminococcaceae bacterium]|nr:LPXTG cell wall anchor domain-containing protein [Oscillospiraceae bacterium]
MLSEPLWGCAVTIFILTAWVRSPVKKQHRRNRNMYGLVAGLNRFMLEISPSTGDDRGDIWPIVIAAVVAVGLIVALIFLRKKK